MMKVKVRSGKKVVEKGDIVDGQKSELMEIDAEKAATNECVLPKENGSGDAETDPVNGMETDNGSPHKKASSRASKENSWHHMVPEYDLLGDISLLRASKVYRNLKVVGTVRCGFKTGSKLKYYIQKTNTLAQDKVTKCYETYRKEFDCFSKDLTVSDVPAIVPKNIISREPQNEKEGKYTIAVIQMLSGVGREVVKRRGCTGRDCVCENEPDLEHRKIMLVIKDFEDVFKQVLEQILDIQLTHGEMESPTKPKARVNPIIKLVNYIQKHESRPVVFLNKFNAVGSKSEIYEQFVEGTEKRKEIGCHLGVLESDWRRFGLDSIESLGNKPNTFAMWTNTNETYTAIMNQGWDRKDDQIFQNQLINWIKVGLPIRHINDRHLIDDCDIIMRRKFGINGCISKHSNQLFWIPKVPLMPFDVDISSKHSNQLSWIPKVPLMSNDIDFILSSASFIDDIFEISVIDFQKLFISALCEIVINPGKIFYAWMKKMTFTRLNDKICSDFLCSKLKTYDCVSDAQEISSNMIPFVWKEVSLHSPENRQTLPENMVFSSRFPEFSLKQCPRKLTVMHRRTMNQNKQLGKPMYGTVDLKTGQGVFVSKSHEPEKDSSDSSKKQDANTDLIKEAILSNSFQQASSNYYTVFPVRKGQRKKLQKRRESQSENDNTRRNPATDGVANGSEKDANTNTTGEEACGANTETFIVSNSFQQASSDNYTVLPVLKDQRKNLQKGYESQSENGDTRRNPTTDGFANGSEIEANRNTDGEGSTAANTETCILSNSFQQTSANCYTVYHVREGQYKELQTGRRRRNPGADGFANGSEIEANKNTGKEGACAANTETYIQNRRIDQVSIDCHHSNSQSVQMDSYKERKSTPLTENACSGNILGTKGCIDKSKPADNNGCANETRTNSDPSSLHNVISRTQNPVRIKESAAESSEHDSLPTDISRQPNSKDERSASNCTDPVINQSDYQSFEPLMSIINKLSRGESVPPQVSMQYEMLRFCTLRSFPKENKPYITRLAQAGFYYARTSDEVVCYCCAQRKRNWQENDIPMDVHRQLNPNCKFLVRNSEVNVPIKTEESFIGVLTSLQGASNMRSASGGATSEENQQPDREVTRATNKTSDIVVQPSNKFSSHSAIGSNISNEVQRDAFVSSCQRFTASNNYPHGHFVQASPPQPQNNENRRQDASNKTFESLESGRLPSQTGVGEFGGQQAALPKYPKYATRTVRMSSFSDCTVIVITPQSLVEAGFFYAGFGDCVRCFQCGVGLRHWSVEDDPWIEHSRWSKECSYVRQMRGQEFVNLVQMAVQYQSNQQNNETAQNENVAGSNQGANGRDEVETLLHKNSAQSVLEMGYHPDLIRRAIRAVLDEKGREAVSASNLMEKIFELEEAETPSGSSVEQGEVLELSNQTINQNSSESAVEQGQLLELSNQTINQNSSSRLHSETFTPRVERKESQRFAETTRGELQNVATENTETRSHAGLSSQLASIPSSSSNNTRVSRSSQLLEKKKLKEENEKLKQQSICTKCKKNEVCIVFLPCGHLVTCETCAATVKYCTVQTCGRYIKGTVRTYLS